MRLAPLARSVSIHRALGHPARLRLLAALDPGELCVCQLAAIVGLAASTVSGHLAELRRAGLLRESRDGRWVSYGWREEAGPQAIRRQLVADLECDPQVEADRALAARLRQAGPESLCRVDLDVPPLWTAGTRSNSRS